MNREEFKKLAEEEFINNTMKHLDSALIFTYIQTLEQKVNNLQSKIDKAIEYIENYYIFDEQNGEYYQTHNFDKSNAKELHDILKEE